MKNGFAILLAVVTAGCSPLPRAEVSSLIDAQRAHPLSLIKTGDVIVTGYLRSWSGNLVLVGSENGVCMPVDAPGLLVLLNKAYKWRGVEGRKVEIVGYLDDETEFDLFSVKNVIPPLGKEALIGPLRHANILSDLGEACEIAG